jgi:hypothetical protein
MHHGRAPPTGGRRTNDCSEEEEEKNVGIFFQKILEKCWFNFL